MPSNREIEAAYEALVASLHPTEKICFGEDGIAAALKAAERVRAVDGVKDVEEVDPKVND